MIIEIYCNSMVLKFIADTSKNSYNHRELVIVFCRQTILINFMTQWLINTNPRCTIYLPSPPLPGLISSFRLDATSCVANTKTKFSNSDCFLLGKS